VSAAPPAVRLDSDVGPLLLPASDRMIAVALERDGVWEPEEGTVLRRLTRKGMTVLDVGAHCGYFTLLFSELVGPEGRVLAVEADPGNHALLEANLEANGAANVSTVQGAAWSAGGETLPFTLCPENTGDHRSYSWESDREVVEVESVAIDDLTRDQGPVDLVKLDTQGTEHRAVEGMSETIERDRPTLVVEFWPLGIRELGDRPEDVIELYRSLGFEIEAVGATGDSLDLVEAADRSPTMFLNLILRQESG
jgi:FkbM family methyltransferase